MPFIILGLFLIVSCLEVKVRKLSVIYGENGKLYDFGSPYKNINVAFGECTDTSDSFDFYHWIYKNVHFVICYPRLLHPLDMTLYKIGKKNGQRRLEYNFPDRSDDITLIFNNHGQLEGGQENVPINYFGKTHFKTPFLFPPSSVDPDSSWFYLDSKRSIAATRKWDTDEQTLLGIIVTDNIFLPCSDAEFSRLIEEANRIDKSSNSKDVNQSKRSIEKGNTIEKSTKTKNEGLTKEEKWCIVTALIIGICMLGVGIYFIYFNYIRENKTINIIENVVDHVVIEEISGCDTRLTAFDIMIVSILILFS